MAVLGAIVLASCGGVQHDPNLVGTWLNPRDKGALLTFRSNGDGDFRSVGPLKTFTWSTNGKSLTIDITGDESQPAESQYLYTVASNGVLNTSLELFGYQQWNRRPALQ